MNEAQVLIIMGVSGSGKSVVGKALAEKLGWTFFDGDDYHPKLNVEKMSKGIPLNDDDRRPWLLTLHGLIQKELESNQSAILASSALKQSYRDLLKGKLENVTFVYLKGSFDLILSRMKARTDHFMKAGMLKSQFATLEEPADALTVSIDASVPAIVQEIIDKLNLS